jgi:hypothetical protein
MQYLIKYTFLFLSLYFGFLHYPIYAADWLEVYNQSSNDIYYISLHAFDKPDNNKIGFWAKHKYHSNRYARQYLIIDLDNHSYCIKQINHFNLQNKNLGGNRYDCYQFSSISESPRIQKLENFIRWYVPFINNKKMLFYVENLRDKKKVLCTFNSFNQQKALVCDEGYKIKLFTNKNKTFSQQYFNCLSKILFKKSLICTFDDSSPLKPFDCYYLDHSLFNLSECQNNP